jgi:hypothetical protein
MVTMPDVPGRLAHLGQALGDARVNIGAIFGSTVDGRVHFVLDEPGALGEVSLVMAKAGINIDSVYVTSAATSCSAWTTSTAPWRSPAAWRS